MSEFINIKSHDALRRQLLSTGSALAFLGVACTADGAQAGDMDRPTVWIDLGGQLERLQQGQDAYVAPFAQKNVSALFNDVPTTTTQRPPRYAFGGEGTIRLQPENSDWLFSAGVRYGRTNGSRRLHQQSITHFKQHGTILGKYKTFLRPITRFNETDSKQRETHAIADFMAGKDVGLGMFGRGSHAAIEVGVRYAQFHAASDVILRSRPDPYYPINQFQFSKPHHHSYYGHADISRSFSGVGPSLSLSGSVPLAAGDRAEMDLDWGANASLLFGRQKIRGRHEETSGYFHGTAFTASTTYDHIEPVARRRSVIIPNVGGFAGLAFRHGDAKVSFGYRADFFFGAMDGGIDTRKTYDRNFYGPFATISIGLGG